MSDLKTQLIEEFSEQNLVEDFGDLTLSVEAKNIVKTCLRLRDFYNFDTLIDLCGVDYLTYGQSDWDSNASSSGFSRARDFLSSNIFYQYKHLFL